MTSSSSLGLWAMLLAVGATPARAQQVDPDRQIAEAVSPLPQPQQAGATVLGYDAAGTLTTLRAGANGMVCLADDPTQPGFHVACYHQSLEPFMARGRALRAEGMTRPQVESIRLAEIEAGRLAMPDHPAALYSLSGGEGLDPETGTVLGARPLFVVYVPYATAESTGLSTQPVQGRPWLMAPGKPWAHIMVTR